MLGVKTCNRINAFSGCLQTRTMPEPVGQVWDWYQSLSAGKINKIGPFRGHKAEAAFPLPTIVHRLLRMVLLSWGEQSLNKH